MYFQISCFPCAIATLYQHNNIHSNADFLWIITTVSLPEGKGN